MLTIDEIELKYNFQYPALYRQLAADYMLYMGEKGPLWYKNEYPKYRQKPPLLLFAKDFEACNLDEVDERIAALRDPKNYRNTNPELVLIPFGTSGAGDDYCFYLSGKTGDDVPIVMVWHDDDKADYFAKNLQDFIFKKLLLAALEIENDGEALENGRNMLASHRPYLTVLQWRILAEVYAREAFRYAGKVGLLCDEEYENIITKEINFNQQNQSFIYALPEPVVEITEANKRRLGCLNLTINQVVDAILQTELKHLNWRQNKSATKNLSYLRHNYVIFGLPCMANLDNTFKQKLQFLKNNFDVSLTFTELETGVTTTL